MSAFPARPRAAHLTLVAARIALAGALGLAGGCASSQSNQAAQGYAQPSQVAAAPPVDVEADGKAAQVPPPARRVQEPDDPSEPWSPNYGSRPPRRPVADQAPAVVVPARPRVAAAD